MSATDDESPGDSQEYDAILDAMDNMHLAVIKVFKSFGALPDPGSKAMEEVAKVTGDTFRSQVLVDLTLRAGRALNAAGEAVEATARLLRLPPFKFMPAPVVRAGLEAAGLALWLLEPSIAAETRLARAVAIKREDLNLDLHLAQAGAKAGPSVSEKAIEASSAALTWSKAQREAFEKQAGPSGIKAVSVPRDRELASRAEGEYEYVLTSGLAHGSTTAYGAIDGMLFGSSPESAGVVVMTYVTCVADAYGRAAFALGQHLLLESGQAALAVALDGIYDQLQINEEARAYFRMVT